MGDEERKDPLVEKVDCLQVAKILVAEWDRADVDNELTDRAKEEFMVSAARKVREVVEQVVAGIDYAQGIPPLTPNQAQAFVDHLTEGPPWRCRGCKDYDVEGDRVRRWEIMGALVGRWHRRCLVAGLEAVKASPEE